MLPYNDPSTEESGSETGEGRGSDRHGLRTHFRDTCRRHLFRRGEQLVVREHIGRALLPGRLISQMRMSKDLVVAVSRLARSHGLEALPAIHGFVSTRLERNFGFTSTVRTDRRIELPWTGGIPSAPAEAA